MVVEFYDDYYMNPAKGLVCNTLITKTHSLFVVTSSKMVGFSCRFFFGGGFGFLWFFPSLFLLFIM